MARLTNAELVHNVLCTIETHGVRVSSGSRLDQMRRLLVNADGLPAALVPPDHPSFEVALEALRDLQILAFVLDGLSGEELPRDFRHRLKRVLKDAALPQETGENSKGRDEQCELYVAAVIARAALGPRFEEPDICCVLDGKRYAVAVKRLKSIGTFQDRIKDGISQVDRADIPGCIVADVSLMLNPANRRITAPISDATLMDLARRTLREFVDEWWNDLFEWTRGSNCQGVILVDHHVRFSPASQWELVSSTLGVNLQRYNRRRHEQFAGFMRRYASGLPAGTEWVGGGR